TLGISLGILEDIILCSRSDRRRGSQGHLSALKSIIKDHNKKNTTDPIRLDFEIEDTEIIDNRIVKGKTIVGDDLKKPFKEALKTPLTRWIIEFAGPEYKMPTNIKLYDGTKDPKDHLSRFASVANSGEWPMPSDLREAFATRYSVRRACFKEPHEITKIIRRANESLTTSKERWMVETGFIMGIPEAMKISSFMDSLKCPKLAKRFSSKVPATANEMMGRLDDFVWSKEDFVRTKLPKGETGELHRRSFIPIIRRDDRPYRNTYGGEVRRRDYQTRVASVLTLDALTKHPKEILATETHLRLPPPRCLINPQRHGNSDRYYDYHQEKGHHTNDCIQLKKQLEWALESGKLNHLVKEVTQRVLSEDVFDEPLIVEAEIKGYLVRRVYIDEGASFEVMFEHCFEYFSPKIKARLKETQTDLVGFAGEVTKPLGKIELEVCFGNEGLCRRTNMKFIVIKAPSPYNVILRRTGLKTLRAIPSTIYSMMKFPIPRGIATLVSRSVIISECQRLEKKQVVEEETVKEEGDAGEVNLTKEVTWRFAWEPADMIGVPQRVIQHNLNVNPSVEPACQKRRVLAPDESDAITKEVDEWVKADNLNSACLKDYYPLPNIDFKVESFMGFKYKCFLDAYKGNHQIQMSKEDEEKTTFYTDQRTYCYTKMPFRLKNAGTTYQRLIDPTFQSQIGRNSEAYVDDMVIKSNDDTMLLVDVAETFDNLKRINMKLNPKKYSFGVEEDKFLGYMVTSEGIRANPKKNKALANLQSPLSLKEMQSLAGKLVALNRFLAKSTERALPFFNTLKNITKENKHEYKWTIKVEEAFQKMKRCIINLQSLTPPFLKETLYAYLAISKEAVSSVLLTDRKGKQCPIHYVSRTLNEA
ncbi:reverse transcriptase domain-containing protein, partial [Tanacetum coccineum]